MDLSAFCGIVSLTNFSAVGTPRYGVPIRQDGMNVMKRPFFRLLTLRLATGQRNALVPCLEVCERHNPSILHLTMLNLELDCLKLINEKID
jgi:hypothetical protein